MTQLRVTELEAHLARSLAPVYALHGDEPLLAPITPHIAHHLWRELNFGDDVMRASWPEPDAAALEQDEIEYVLQVNGKKKGNFFAPREASQEQTATLAISFAQKYVGDQKIKKTVVVPGRLVNLVL